MLSLILFCIDGLKYFVAFQGFKQLYKIQKSAEQKNTQIGAVVTSSWRHQKTVINSDEERRFMYKINQGHLTIFCIVFVWLGGPPSPVRIMTQVPWFMYQNQLGPSGGIYHPNFVPCFVVLYLNYNFKTEFGQIEPYNIGLGASFFELISKHFFLLIFTGLWPHFLS